MLQGSDGWKCIAPRFKKLFEVIFAQLGLTLVCVIVVLVLHGDTYIRGVDLLFKACQCKVFLHASVWKAQKREEKNKSTTTKNKANNVGVF